MPAIRTAPLVTAALALATVIALPMMGHAQDDLRAKGKKACGGDAARLCKGLTGDGVVLSCFQENQSRLSAACRKFLVDVGQL